MAFLTEIKQAYETENLTLEPILRKAMIFENYEQCPVPVRDDLTASAEWPNLDVDSESPGYGYDSLFRALKGQGANYNPQQLLHHVIPTKTINGLYKFPRNLLTALRDPGLDPGQRVARFEAAVWRAWRDTVDKEGRLTWLFHHDAGEADDTLVLLRDLGLYHYGERFADHTFFKLTFAAKACKKPNWVDADLAFYFHQTDGNEEHGWTRSLRTGEPGFPEMVRTSVGELELADVRVLALGEDHHFSKLSDEYREIQRARIQGDR